MVKDCVKHGHFEDLMSIDPEFSKHLEDVFPGRDIKAHNDEKLHHHGSSTVKYGRGSVLTVDPVSYTHLDVYKRQLWAQA